MSKKYLQFRHITHSQGTREEWQFAFFVTCGLQVVSLTFYCVFASGELQPWARDTYLSQDSMYQQLDGEDDNNEGMRMKEGGHKATTSNGEEQAENNRTFRALNLLPEGVGLEF